MQITIRYGIDSINKEVHPGTTFRDVIADPSIKAGLGCGDNVKATVSGVEMPLDAQVPLGAMITLETRANTKALLLAA